MEKKRKRECKVSKERAVENGKEKVQIKGRPHIYSCPSMYSFCCTHKHLQALVDACDADITGSFF